MDFLETNGQVFVEFNVGCPIFLWAIFRVPSGESNFAVSSIFESTWMESYSLALQLQAAQELVSEKMPRRALLVKLLLFTEVASALLMVQLGQFTHAGLIVIPFFLTSLMAIHREHWAHSIHIPDPRSVLLSVLSPKNYSMFGLRRRQEGIATFLAITVFLRILCLVPVAVTLSGECANPKCFFHMCHASHNWILESKIRMDRPPDCEWPASWVDFGGTVDNRYYRWHNTPIDRIRIAEWCQKNLATLPKVPATMWRLANHTLLWPTSNVSGLCGKELNLVPAMARHACIAGTLDPLLYQTCLKDAWLPNMCNAQFIFCSNANSHLEGQAIVVLTYMLIPSAALLLMLVIHLLVLIFGNFSTTQAQEDVELRRAVRRRSANLQERLQNDQLDSDGSLWWRRRSLEARLVFFLSDIVLDMICCVNFFRAEAYAFGGCQLVILTFSGILQLKVGFVSTWKAIRNSLHKGLPYNVVHLLLLQEKTFEAPLSLCFQFYAAFYVNENLAAFVSLWVSMFFSIVGIANGIYIHNHLTPFDLDLLEEEELSEIPPSTIGVSSLSQGIQAPVALPPPPGLGFTPEMVRPKQTLPPPPGLGFTPSRVKEGRKPGQFVSDTEWKQDRFGPFWYHVTMVTNVTFSPFHNLQRQMWKSQIFLQKRAPFALFFFPWWKVKILGAAKYSGDFLPAIDALFLWIAWLKLGMDWEITEPTFLTLEWIPNFWETYGFLWIDFWINKIQQKDLSWICFRVQWRIFWKLWSVRGWVGFGWIQPGSSKRFEFFTLLVALQQGTLGCRPPEPNFFPSTRHLKMGRFNKVWEWLSMQLAVTEGYDG